MKYPFIKAVLYFLAFLIVFQAGVFVGMALHLEVFYASPRIIQRSSEQFNNAMKPYLWNPDDYYDDTGTKYHHLKLHWQWEDL